MASGKLHNKKPIIKRLAKNNAASNKLLDARRKQRLSYLACPLPLACVLAVSARVNAAVRCLLIKVGFVPEYKNTMTLVLKIIVTLCLTAIVGISTFAQDVTPNKLKKKITVCRFELTESGRQSSFHFTFLYRLEVSETGKAPKIIEILNHKKYAKFVRDDLFLECMKNWRLEPGGKYYVYFNIGTTSDPTTISITDPNKETLVLDYDYLL